MNLPRFNVLGSVSKRHKIEIASASKKICGEFLVVSVGVVVESGC